MKKITVFRAVELMRNLSEQNIPFSIKYCSFNESKKESKGFKSENNILLMKGYRRNQSDKSDLLVSFQRMDTRQRRQFYLPLLIEFNGIKIKNGK